MRLSLGLESGLFLCAAVLLSTAPLGGQTLTVTILGTVTDPTQPVVQCVQVNITEVNTNYHRTETSNDSGFFAFGNLDPGNYRLDVEHTRFRKLVRSDIVVGTNTTIRVDVELTPGASSASTSSGTRLRIKFRRRRLSRSKISETRWS